jgi:hypothetical protein
MQAPRCLPAHTAQTQPNPPQPQLLTPKQTHPTHPTLQTQPQDEEDHLIDLMREEEAAEKRRADALAAAAKREAQRQEMLVANAEMLRLKVWGWGTVAWVGCCWSFRSIPLSSAGLQRPMLLAQQLLFSARWRAFSAWQHGPALSANAAHPMQAERAVRERSEEEAFRVATMARFAEDDRVEQMNAQRRRLKVQVSRAGRCAAAAAWQIGAAGAGHAEAGGHRRPPPSLAQTSPLSSLTLSLPEKGAAARPLCLARLAPAACIWSHVCIYTGGKWLSFTS